MAFTTDTGRGMTPAKEKFWKEQNNKAELMRLRWFTKNQLRLKEIAEKEATRKALSPEVLAEVEKMKLDRYRTIERMSKGRRKSQEFTLPDIDPNSIMNVMKPVKEKITRLLYTNTEKRGTTTYLLTRCKMDRPEDRYYFPEVSSFVYGWRIREAQKAMADEPRYGRRQVIKESFYRRNGALNVDPPFYREPQ